MKELGDIAARMAEAVEHVAPKTWELMVRANWTTATVWLFTGVAMSACLMAGAMQANALSNARRIEARSGARWNYTLDSDADTWRACSVVFIVAAVTVAACAVGANLPMVLCPDGVTARDLVAKVLQ